MPAGIHLLLGILLALFKRNWPEYKFGVVFGSILPDIDVVLTALVALFTFDTSFTSSESFTEIQQFLEYWHRSVSHSVIVIALLFILFFALSRLFHYDFLGFGVGLSVGMLKHVVLDVGYLKGVRLLWPLDETLFFYPWFSSVGLHAWADLSPDAQKWIMTLDHLCELLLFYGPMLFISRQKMVNTVHVNKEGKVTARTSMPWHWWVVLFFTILQAVTIAAFMLICALKREWAVMYYLQLLYSFGFYFYALEVAAPLLFRDTILNL